MNGQHYGPTVGIVNHNLSSTPAIDTNTTIAAGTFTILLPLAFTLSVILQRRYRQRLRQHRITQLEQMWSISSRRNAY
jgi:hypothetical protein